MAITRQASVIKSSILLILLKKSTDVIFYFLSRYGLYAISQ
jgi:hypothetical protein